LDDNNVTPFPKKANEGWQKIIQDIQNQFNGGPNGGNQGGGGQQQLGGILIFLVIVGLITAWSSFYTVDISEEAVITRLGKYLKTVGPGPHLKAPLFIDQVTKVPKRILQLEFGFRTDGNRESVRSNSRRNIYKNESLMLTGDLNVADVAWIVKYSIKDAWKYLFHAKEVSRNIRDVSMSIMRRVVGDRRVGEVLTVARVEIASNVKELMQELLNRYDLGVKIEQVLLQDVNPPEPVKPAFNEVNAAKQEQEQAINIAERGYNKIIPASRGKAEKLIADAEAYAIDKVNRAKGDANRFNAVYAEYRRAPSITKKRMYLESIEKVFMKMENMIIVDDKVRGLMPLFSGMTTLPKSPAK
jgi:modulator of FtsH protease HflK